MQQIEWSPLPGIKYAHDYTLMFSKVVSGELPEIPVWRYLITEDLFFLLHFVLKIPGVNRKFVIERCEEINLGPKDKTLDVVAREHYKTTCITIGETIQYVLKYPNHCTAIFCYIKPRAEDFIASIKDYFTKNEILKYYFPDVLYPNPERDASRWSVDKGIVVIRNTNRPEPTVGAYGLLEGMPTGVHFERRVYDDIVTDDISDNYETMEKVKKKIDMSMSLGKEGGTHRVLGTYYNYDDPLCYLRDKKEINNPDKPVYHLRFYPATIDGTINGTPVLVSQEYLDSLKTTRTFYTQYLLDPSPLEVKKLNKDCLKVVGIDELPDRLYRFMLIDPSGKKGTGDPWAILIVGVCPDKDDIGTSSVYILKALIEKFTLDKAIKASVDMYCNGGKILCIGVEEVGQSTTEVHIADALNAKGYDLSVDNGGIVIFKPRKRSKIDRINELSWPLHNGKIHILDTVPIEQRKTIQAEIFGFPNSKDDHAIDTLSYFWIDLLHDYDFPIERTNVFIPKPIPMGAYT